MLKTTQVLEAHIKVTVQKTRKTYHRKYLYAKHVNILLGPLKVPTEEKDEYYLREGRGWRKVSKEEFDQATTEEMVEKLHKKLSNELRQRVEREMSE